MKPKTLAVVIAIIADAVWSCYVLAVSGTSRLSSDIWTFFHGAAAAFIAMYALLYFMMRFVAFVRKTLDRRHEKK